MTETVPSEPIVKESILVVETVPSPAPAPLLVEEPAIINLLSDNPPLDSKNKEDSQAPDNVDSELLFLPLPPSFPEPYTSTSYRPMKKVKKPKRFLQPFVEVPLLSPTVRKKFVTVKSLDGFPVVSRLKCKPKETKVLEPLSPKQGEFQTFTIQILLLLSIFFKKFSFYLFKINRGMKTPGQLASPFFSYLSFSIYYCSK